MIVLLLVVIATLAVGVASAAPLEDFESRRRMLIENTLLNVDKDSLPVQAYESGEVDEDLLNLLLGRIPTNPNADFQIVDVVRILFLTGNKYDAQVKPVLTSLPYWITPGEAVFVYWSENHHILWMSCEWLLHERYDDMVISKDLELRLLHWLDAKIEYGFYEFFAPIYFPFTMAGLLTLVDFVQDETIQQKAILATERLLTEILLLLNDRGAYFPSAGRSSPLAYIDQDRDSACYQVLWQLTGLAKEVPTVATRGSSHLVTTSGLPPEVLERIITSWTPSVDLVFQSGHSLKEGSEIYNDLSRQDRTMAQWSSGAYFHPLVVDDTLWLLKELDLYDHGEFEDFGFITQIPPPALGQLISSLGDTFTTGSVLASSKVAIYRDGPSVLSSVQDFWPGRYGYQVWPWVATTGTIPVWTQSGEVNDDMYEGDKVSYNQHIPYVKQQGNMALIMYKPELLIGVILGARSREVALYWPEDRFEEVREHNEWVLGKEGDGYIAIARPCLDRINGQYACNNRVGQTWAVVVGNAETYGDFDAFAREIRNAKFVSGRLFSILYGRLKVGGTEIRHIW